MGLRFFGIAMVVNAAFGCKTAVAQSCVPPADVQNTCDSLALSGQVLAGFDHAVDALLRTAAFPTAGAVPKPSEAVKFATLTPKSLQSFVKNWQPADKPLCKILRTNADWERWMGAAAVMGPHRPYAPSTSLWSQHSVVLIARVVDASDPSTVFEVRGVRSDREALDIAYHMKKPSPASHKIGAWIGVVVGNSELRPRVDVIEDGAIVCSIDSREKAASVIAPPGAGPHQITIAFAAENGR